MSLDDWLNNRWLELHRTTPAEIATLLRKAEEDMLSARQEVVSAGWRLTMAYTSALTSARIALYATGYRPGRDREHERTIDSLALTIRFPDEQIRLFHRIRKKRHVNVYESNYGATDVEVLSAIELGVDLLQSIRTWLGENHPGLIK